MPKRYIAALVVLWVALVGGCSQVQLAFECLPHAHLLEPKHCLQWRLAREAGR